MNWNRNRFSLNVRQTTIKHSGLLFVSIARFHDHVTIEWKPTQKQYALIKRGYPVHVPNFGGLSGSENRGGGDNSTSSLILGG